MQAPLIHSDKLLTSMEDRSVVTVPPLQEEAPVNRFGSWYRNDSLADITVCFKLHSNDVIFAAKQAPDTVTSTCYTSTPTACSAATGQPQPPPSCLLPFERTTSATDSAFGSCSTQLDSNSDDYSPKRKRPRLQPPTSAVRKGSIDPAAIIARFPAHRLVLGSMSDVFKAQFDNWDTSPGIEISIILDTKEDLAAAHEMVRFMYFEKLSAPSDAAMLLTVARLADQYQVLKCLDACSDALCALLASLQPVKPPNSTSKSADTSPPAYADHSNIDLLIGVMMLDERVGTPLDTLQKKCVDILRAWFKDFDTAWNHAALRALFLQLPFNYLSKLLDASNTINVISENSIATALHYWAQAQPQGTVTPELSTALLKLLHFLGLSVSYLTIVLPTLPTFSLSPLLMRYLGEASRLKMSDAFRHGQESIDPRTLRSCREKQRDTNKEGKDVFLRPEDWWHIVARPYKIPPHFSRKRSGTLTTKQPWSFTFSVPYTQIQALYTACAIPNSSIPPGIEVCKRGPQVVSPSYWHQGLIFTSRLLIVLPTDQRPPGLGETTPATNGGTATPVFLPADSQLTAETRVVRVLSLDSDNPQEGGPAQAARATAEGEAAAEEGADGGSQDPAVGTEPSLSAATSLPKLQCAMTVQVDPSLAEMYSSAGVQMHLHYWIKIHLTNTETDKSCIQKTCPAALMPLDGYPLWKPLWRQTPQFVFDPKNDGCVEITVQINEVK